MSTQSILISSIRIDGGTQPRTEVDVTLVSEYAQSMRDGDEFPPVVVYFDGVDYWLADGFHRYHAASKNGLESVSAYVRPGTQRDAVLCSVGANAAHGARRTNADKRKAVLTLLNDSEWSQWSDREIARRCGVSNDFVSRLRPSLSSDDSESRTYTTKHGTVATMNTVNIGKRHAKHDEVAKQLRAGASTEQIKAALNVSPESIRQVRIIEGLMGIDKSADAVAQRRERLAHMASEGYTSDQIADALGISVEGCRKMAKECGVTLAADKARGATFKHDSNRILEHIVMDAENLTADTSLIAFASLDRARLGAWIDSLVQSRRSLDALIKVLRREHQDGEAA